MVSMLTNPTFIIGLGGIGEKVTFLVADRFHNSHWRGVPETLRIRAIDTAPPEPRDIPTSKYRYFTQLGQFDADEVIQYPDLYPEIENWWQYALTPGFINLGAGAERPVGRLVFFKNLDRINAVLTEDFRVPLADALQNSLIKAGLEQVKKQPQVYIVGSIAGGTCSGMLIDVAFLVRWLLEKVGYDKGGINITAILGLQSVIEVAAKDGTLDAAQKRRLNCFGAIREIDFLQEGWSSTLQLKYPNPVGSFHPKPPLFNQVYFFSATNLQGFYFSNQKEILNRVAHFIFGQVASETGEVAGAIMDNRKYAFNPDQRRFGDGLKAIYGAFGVEWLEVPLNYLLSSWCQEHAESLGKLVNEFEWSQEPKENLTQKFHGLIVPELNGYRKALGLIALGPEGILSAAELLPLKVHLDAIQDSKKKGELETALQEWENTLPNLMGQVRTAVSVAGEPAQEDKWLLDVVQNLLRDRKYRLGGARRVLTEAAGQLRGISENIDVNTVSVKELVKQATGFFKKVDTTLASEWARKKAYQTVRQIIQQKTGQQADRLANRLEAAAAGIQRLQDQVRDVVYKLKHKPQEMDLTPKDTWLLNPNDIKQMLHDNPEELARRGADEIASSLAGEISLATLLSQDMPNLEKDLLYWIETAIEKAIETRIQRPQDSVERIKHQMARCEPLARITTDGPEFLKIMKPTQKSTPLKIVLTGLGDADLHQLVKWADDENAQQGGERAYQVSHTGETLRDDVVQLTLGWPLWLFDEIRPWDALAMEIKEQNPPLYSTSFVLTKQIPQSSIHEIKPMAESAAGQWFGIALALKDIDFQASTISFSPERFPGSGEVSGENIGDRINKAFALFRQLGLSWKYETFIKGDENQDIAQFKQRLEEGVAKRQGALDQARQQGQISDDVYNKLTEFYNRAIRYAEGIVIL